jgi:hypothetical protein
MGRDHGSGLAGDRMGGKELRVHLPDVHVSGGEEGEHAPLRVVAASPLELQNLLGAQ